MRRPALLLCGILLMAGGFCPALAAGAKALALRQAQGLTAVTPPDAFLNGNFIADEINPQFIFGTIRAFAASRSHPTAWLVEEGVKHRLASPRSPEAAMEYTLYLEEDRPDGVIHYVFVDQSGMTPQQWLEWRRKFHKSKAEPQFAQAKSRLEKACQDGCGVSGELRFILKNGELLGGSPEEHLRTTLKFPPLYDLNQGKKLSR